MQINISKVEFKMNKIDLTAMESKATNEEAKDYIQEYIVIKSTIYISHG